MVTAPTMRQYIAKYISLPRLTMFIIHLHAAHPDRNAAIKPTSSGNGSTPSAHSVFGHIDDVEYCFTEYRGYYHKE